MGKVVDVCKVTYNELRPDEADFQQVLAEIENRDQADFTREHGPLKQAPDAIVIDTTHLSIEQQVEHIYQLATALVK